MDGDIDDECSIDEYVPIKSRIIHKHEHLDGPHMHNNECNRLTSAIDKDRAKRFYFTNSVTPVRVYISYENNSKNDKYNLETINGMKLGRSVLFGIGLSPKFVDEAANFIFHKDTLSFIPAISDKKHNIHKVNVKSKTKK